LNLLAVLAYSFVLSCTYSDKNLVRRLGRIGWIIHWIPGKPTILSDPVSKKILKTIRTTLSATPSIKSSSQHALVFHYTALQGAAIVAAHAT
jgi:hypothetical protein